MPSTTKLICGGDKTVCHQGRPTSLKFKCHSSLQISFARPSIQVSPRLVDPKVCQGGKSEATCASAASSLDPYSRNAQKIAKLLTLALGMVLSRSGCTSVQKSAALGSAAIRAFTFNDHQQPAPSKGPRRTTLKVCGVPFAVAADFTFKDHRQRAWRCGAISIRLLEPPTAFSCTRFVGRFPANKGRGRRKKVQCTGRNVAAG